MVCLEYRDRGKFCAEVRRREVFNHTGNALFLKLSGEYLSIYYILSLFCIFYTFYDTFKRQTISLILGSKLINTHMSYLFSQLIYNIRHLIAGATDKVIYSNFPQLKNTLLNISIIYLFRHLLNN